MFDSITLYFRIEYIGRSSGWKEKDIYIRLFVLKHFTHTIMTGVYENWSKRRKKKD